MQPHIFFLNNYYFAIINNAMTKKKKRLEYFKLILNFIIRSHCIRHSFVSRLHSYKKRNYSIHKSL